MDRTSQIVDDDASDLSVDETMGDLPVFSSGQMMIKRMIDVAGAVVAGIVFLPVIALVAVLVKCTSRGPVLFKHERVGLGGERFRLWKFRSMREGTHERIWGDPRPPRGVHGLAVQTAC